MTERQSRLYCAAGCVLLVGVVALSVSLFKSPRYAKKDLRSPEAKEATELRTDAQRDYSAGRHGDAERRLQDVLRTYGDSEDKDTQDQVAAASMTLGFMAADRGEFGAARQFFEAIDQDYAGSGAEHPEYGRLDDQAAYQAVVCLQAEGKTQQAVKEYVRYLQERQSSPLIYAVHKRLRSLDPERADEHEALLQKAIDARDAHVRKQLAMCGPRAVERLIRILGDKERPVDEIATLCGTTDDGTTMADLAKGLGALGYQTKGLRLNLNDFKKADAPLIWLLKTHYVVVLDWHNGKVRYYDPMYSSERALSVPPDQEADFFADVLTVSRKIKETSK